MRCGHEDDAYLSPASDSPGFGWMRYFSRLAGCIQMLFAVFLGVLAIVEIVALVDDLVHYGKYIGKGIYIGANPYNVFGVVTFSSLSFTGLFGGFGLLRLRPWARRWEIAYLSIISAAVASVLIVMYSGRLLSTSNLNSLTVMVEIAIVFALPYLPLVLIGRPSPVGTWPCEPTARSS